METELEQKNRHRNERMKAMMPPIHPFVMSFLVLGCGILIAAICFALGAEFVFVWPILAVAGFAIFSLNALIVRRRLERLEETHRIERTLLQGVLRDQKEAKK